LGGLRGSMDLFLLQTAGSSLKTRILGEKAEHEPEEAARQQE
jgi:hypothetical protein